MKRQHEFATRAIHAGQAPDPSTGAIMTPIYATSTYVQESPGKHKGYDYSRSINPTRLAYEKCIAEFVVVDPTTRTAYTISELSNTITVINTATCTGTHHSGCPTTVPPALAVGLNPLAFVINPETQTIYEPSQDTNTVWVLDISKCNAAHTQGC